MEIDDEKWMGKKGDEKLFLLEHINSWWTFFLSVITNYYIYDSIDRYKKSDADKSWRLNSSRNEPARSSPHTALNSHAEDAAMLSKNIYIFCSLAS